MKRIRNARFGWVVAGLLAGTSSWASAQHRTPGAIGAAPPTSQTPGMPTAAESGRSTSGSTGLGGGGMLIGSIPDDLGDSTVRRNIDAIRLNMANTERQKALTREATQLLQMAAELQLKISRNTPGISQEEMARQVEAIEKLARSVKDRMKGAR